MEIKHKRICRQCGHDVYHKSENSLKLAIYLKRTCRQCKSNNQKRIVPYNRLCPKCNKNISYKHASNYFYGKKYNTKCQSCSKIGILHKKTKKSKYFKCCANCNTVMYYSRADSLKSAVKNKTVCWNCQNRNHRKWCIENRTVKYPKYNKEACELFDLVNKEFNLNGIHAGNGKEVHIKELGYFLDYYEPSINLVIEYDEDHHELPKNLIKDLKRQKEIENYLNCNFIRIKQKEKHKWKEILNGQI